MIGATAAPRLAGLSAAPSADRHARIGWQLTAPRADTAISIYANGGPITTTLVITGSNGAPETVEIPFYTGQPLLSDLIGSEPGWTDGSPQSVNLDVSALRSGSYHLWIEADDAHGGPARAYLPGVIAVDQAWLPTWNAGLTAVASYRQLAVSWQRHPNPDADRYRLRIGSQPGVYDRAVDVGENLRYMLTGLTPRQSVYLRVEAISAVTGQAAASEALTATPSGAVFTVTVEATAPVVRAGETATVTLRIRSGVSPYPDLVGLQAGDLPTGFALTLPEAAIRPTAAGVLAPVGIHVAPSLAGGSYTLPLVAIGGGYTVSADLPITVRAPRFELAASPPAATLQRDGSAAITIGTRSFDGAQSLIRLSLDSAPVGLRYSFTPAQMLPGANATLALTDTVTLASGIYALRIVGEDGMRSVDLPVSLQAIKPDFTVGTARPSVVLTAGSTACFVLDLGVVDNWSAPVTIALDPAFVPPGASARFIVGGSTCAVEGVLPPAVVVPPATVRLALRTSTATPHELFRLPLAVSNGARARTVDLYVKVRDGLPTWLPLIRR